METTTTNTEVKSDLDGELTIDQRLIARVAVGRSKRDSQTLTPDPLNVVMLDPWSLDETPENFEIYRHSDETDPTWLELKASVAENGVLQALEVSRDGFVISGHRRLSAARCTFRESIPCIVCDVLLGDLSPEERIKLLVSRNQGIRIKSDSESYLEAAAAVDPQQAIREAESRKAQVFKGEEVPDDRG